ncbi:electron transport complex subunit RsxC [Vibrio sp. HN007]|uniref:electron transport complex subunit RsxC n=1 Tax=Vibrio iocasae TaxID=3098914 RepID=UPI0035D49B6B
MSSLIQQIRHGSLWTFHGGVHPPENKQQSTTKQIVKADVPSELILPIKQHIGRPGDLTVKVGDKVKKGQELTRFTASFMLPLHAPTSGTITAIEPRVTAHPSGLKEVSIVLQSDGEDQWHDSIANAEARNPSEIATDDIIEIIRHAGIAGMGGAGFPTARKIQSGLAKTEVLIVNAAECEPYITADDMLMREHAEELIQGINIVEQILKPKLVVIGIEDNKPEALKALQDASLNQNNLVIRAIPTKYPSGGEKQLIKILTNKEVPKGGIPADVGVLVQNVGSLYAIKRAVINHEPLIERVVTLTGNAFRQPRNVWARIGTPVRDLLKQFDYHAEKKHPRLILGGPMMGFTLPTDEVPITKISNCILAPTRKEFAPKRNELACIRCGQCAEVCPATLLPQQMLWYSKDKDYDKCEELNIADCIECGACAYVCPSEIPLVQYYRQSKAEIRSAKQEAEAAERAKQRFEEKKARLERDKAERENKFKKAADDRRKNMQKSGDGDAVAAAIARVKAQKTALEPEKDSPKPAVAAAIARAKAKQAAAKSGGNAEPDNAEMNKLREERKQQARERKAEKAAQEANASPSESENKDDKKAAIAAAIARAKAKKQAKQEEPFEPVEAEQTESNESPADKKKAAVAAAIARAKAKKQAKQEEPSEPVEAEQPESNESPADKKKAAVAAAIARAKAKKQAKQEEPSEPVEAEQPEAEASPEDKKKAAVAAAIARAKAKKQANQEAQAEPIEAEQSEAEESPEDKKKAAVAAAIARAKAKKLAAEKNKQANEENN